MPFSELYDPVEEIPITKCATVLTWDKTGADYLVIVLHDVWDYLLPLDHHKLIATTPVFEAYYAHLYQSTTTVLIHQLCWPCPPPDSFIGLQHDCSCQMAITLIHFDLTMAT
jgi:hypothetical protein